MAPGARRPAGDDPVVDRYRSTCTCGYNEIVLRYQQRCPKAREHTPALTYRFTCTHQGG